MATIWQFKEYAQKIKGHWYSEAANESIRITYVESANQLNDLLCIKEDGIETFRYKLDFDIIHQQYYIVISSGKIYIESVNDSELLLNVNGEKVKYIRKPDLRTEDQISSALC